MAPFELKKILLQHLRALRRRMMQFDYLLKVEDLTAAEKRRASRLLSSIQLDIFRLEAEQLAELRAALVKNEDDINVMVEGHTDNVRISRTSQYMKDNWDLSVMRATSIIRILVDKGVPPQRITASGKGEFSPVAENNSAESRKKNRRTEIILTPKLDELFKLLE